MNELEIKIFEKNEQIKTRIKKINIGIAIVSIIILISFMMIIINLS
jgi:hypothetical protein